MFTADDNDAQLGQIVRGSAADEREEIGPQKRSGGSLLEGKRRQPRSLRQMSGSESLPPRHYTTCSRAVIPVLCCTPCLIPFSCRTCSSLALRQRMKVRAASPALAAIPPQSSSSNQAPFAASQRPAQLETHMQGPDRSISYFKNAVSLELFLYCRTFPLTTISSSLTCPPLSLRLRAAGEREDSSMSNLLLC